MVEIIKPKFRRDRERKLRMLKRNPSLAEHPEFQNLDEPSDVVSPTLLVAVLGILFVLLGKKR